MSLDDILRVRCEPELKAQLEAIAKSRRIKASALAREIMWQFVEQVEGAYLNDEANSTARALADEAADDALRAARRQTQAAAPVRYSKPAKRRA